jgi:regulation of enolase protein 1 (concanavalin A-like superfamily)
LKLLCFFAALDFWRSANFRHFLAFVTDSGHNLGTPVQGEVRHG